MFESWRAVAELVAHGTAAGGTVLLIGWVVCRLTPAPARRQYAAAWAVRGAVVAAGLSLFPSWIAVPRWGAWPAASAADFRTTESTTRTEEVLDSQDLLSTTPVPSEFVTADLPGIDFDSQPEPLVPFQDSVQPVGLRPANDFVDAWTEAVPVVLGLYAVIAAALIGQLVVGHAALWRLRRSASPAPRRVREVFDALDVTGRYPALVTSDRVETPVCFGVFRPTVVLPRQLAEGATIDELRWVVAHELDHLNRGDPVTAVWVGVARGLFFVCPWFWAVRRDLTLSQEYLADAAAAAADGRAVDYAAFLVNLSDPTQPTAKKRSRRRSPTMLAAHAVRAGRSDLFRRVNMLLKSGVSRRCPRGWASLATGGLMSAAVVLSGLGWAAADDDQPTRPKAEKKAPPAPPKPPADAEKAPEPPVPPKPPAPPTPPKVTIYQRQMTANPEQVQHLKEQIDEAVRDGKVDEVHKLVEKLEKALSPKRVELREFKPHTVEGVDRAPQFVAPNVPFRVEAPFRFEQGADNAKDAKLQAVEAKMQEALAKLAEMQSKLGEKHPEMIAQQKALEALRAQLDATKQGQWYVPNGQNSPRTLTLARTVGGRFGVAVARVPEVLFDQLDLQKGTGLLVVDVADGSPAEKAGVRKNDVIVLFDQKTVPADEGQFIRTVGEKGSGTVNVVVLRKGRNVSLTATLPEPPKLARKVVETEDRGAKGKKVAFNAMNVHLTETSFDIKAERGETKYVVTGAMEDGKPTPSTIVISEGDDKKEYESLEKVPGQQKAAIKQLLSSVSGR